MVDQYFVDKKSYDCYASRVMGVFVPVNSKKCKLENIYEYPCYEVIIDFDDLSNEKTVYIANISSPFEKHSRKGCRNCYIILIEKEYFDKIYAMYRDKIEIFNGYKFEVHIDILKNINSFIYEYTKQYKNSEVLINAQVEIIVHWIIRFILGENYNQVMVSSNYSIAKVQQFIEQHYMDNITVKMLAELGCMSETTFNRHFKKEIGLSPIEYLLDVRIRKAKEMLRRNELNITEIAISCGFSSVAYFSSCFTSRVNSSPQEYRKSFI